MRRPFPLAPAVLALLAAPAIAQPDIHPDELALKPKIDKAIAAGVEHILDQQRRDGSWSGDNYPGGRTALCVYALLKSGVGLDHPAMQRALAFLDTVEPQKTYSTACMMLAYSATGDEKYLPRLRRLLARLLEWQGRGGSWAYPGSAEDLSNTQYAALGLWTANKAGLKIPDAAWRDLIKGTLQYQEAPHDVKVAISKKTGAAQLRVAGFEYRRSSKKPPYKATGTMTTAGVSVLKICEIGLGKRLRKRERAMLKENIDLGLNWLAAHFSVQHPQLPGKRGRWLHYYLYGMERVGALTREEVFGNHRWYVEGARALLRQQRKGGWGNALHDTCFALLFLRRATGISGPTTGGAGGKSTHLFAAGGANDDIQFRGAGQRPVMLYINGFGKPLLAEHGQLGLRILRVEYLEGKRKLGELAGDPTKAWARDTFLHRCTSLSHGAHTIVARVIALPPDAPNGETSKTITIESKPMQVIIRDVIEPWMTGITDLQSDNVLRDARPTVTATSNPAKARQVADGLDASHWLAESKDANPTVSIEFKRPVVARRLWLTQALGSRADLAKVGVIRVVEFRWDRSRRAERIELNANPLAPTVFEFGKPIRIGSFSLRVVERSGKKGLPVGFAEIGLGNKRDKGGR